VYFDQQTVEENIKEFPPEAGGKHGRRLVMSDGVDVKVIELDAGVDLGDKPVSKAIFSAKISAHP
jgi:uncharacterized protein YwlG (UPF0340 family)